MTTSNICINIPNRAYKQQQIIQMIPDKYLQIEEEKVFLSGVYVEKKRMKDVHRYVLELNSEKFEISKKFLDGVGVFNDKPINGHKNPSILLIIESPHKEEYDENFNPISLAQGATGRNIEKYVCRFLSQTCGKNLSSEKYDLIISNPVQFQASLFHLHHQPLNLNEVAAIRNKVWKSIFANEKEDFIKRIENYRSVAIINGCTAGVKQIVTDSLLEWRENYNGGVVPELIISNQHPCIWPFGTQFKTE